MTELRQQPDDSGPAQIQRPAQYPTATRIEDGMAYDISGKALGSVNIPSTTSASAQPQSQPASPDPVEQVLRGARGVDNNALAGAWDAYQNSADEDELAGKIQNIQLPQDIKAKLWDMKHGSSNKLQSVSPQSPEAWPQPAFLRPRNWNWASPVGPKIRRYP